MEKHKRSKLKHSRRHRKNRVLDQGEYREYVTESRDHAEDMFMSNEFDCRDLKQWSKHRRDERRRDYSPESVGLYDDDDDDDDGWATQERRSVEIYRREKTTRHPSLRTTFGDDWNEPESFLPSAVATRQNQLKRHRESLFDEEQKPRKIRRRILDASPRWGSPAVIVSGDDGDSDSFHVPISLQSLKAFHARQVFIAKALAELVSMKMESGRALPDVKIKDFKESLYRQGIEFESHKSFMEIMLSLSAHFDITHNMIKPRTDVKICERYTQNPKQKHSGCHDLHICKFYLVGTCFSDKSCKFSHDILQSHNKEVLKRHFLNKMEPEYVGEIVSYVHNRNEKTSPTVCKFYNNEGGCTQQQRCQHLHVCLHFVTKTCKFGARCMRDHDFNSPHSEHILRKYGLLQYQANYKVLFELIGNNLQNGMIVTQKFPDKNIK